MGNKQLASRSEEIKDFSTQALYDLIQDMQDTKEAKGGVGIAAPQIGHNKRIIIFGFEHSPRYPNEKPVPPTILINPIIEFLSDEMIDRFEGCLSVPGLRGLVPRYNKIKYTGFDPEGNPISRVAEGFHARMVQHETDHLDGILFPERIKDLRYFGYEDELERVIPGLKGIPIKKIVE
jgi:peptide deformylase